MRCPFCAAEDTQVKDSRPMEDGQSIKRRRLCSQCQSRFTTFERVQFCALTVLKRDGSRQPFDRDKIERSILTAMRKRPYEPSHIDRVVNALVQKLEAQGDGEISTEEIGRAVMNVLVSLDPVAYVRFASVYQAFASLKDFQEVIKSHPIRQAAIEEENITPGEGEA